jgi:SAM-dependent methyltransferase
MRVLNQACPDYRKRDVHESSPRGRDVSARLQKECKKYSYSHYQPHVQPGRNLPGTDIRCETLEALTFDDEAFDLIITQDVMEHVLDPVAAFREIARVLKPGGAHIFTVPLLRKGEASRPRARRAGDGSIEYLLDKEYHSNPVDGSGSLVTMDWGYEIMRAIHDATGMAGQITNIDDIDRGIRAEYIDVVVSRKR